jgi:hypothetical protein
MDVCRADRAAWFHLDEQTDYILQETKHVTDRVKNTNPAAKLSYRELNLRIMEMATCQSVDEQNSDNYYSMHRFYSDVVNDRYRGFVVRHDLLSKLIIEDAAGIR